MKPGLSEPARPDTGMPVVSKIFYFIERCPMKPLLSALNDIPEYRSLLSAIDGGAARRPCPACRRCTGPTSPPASARRPAGRWWWCAPTRGRPSGWPGIWPPCRGRRCAPSPPGSSPSTTPPWCPGSTSTGGSPSSGPWRRGSAPCWCARRRPSSSAPCPRPCWRGPPGAAHGGEPRPQPAGRDPHRRGLHPVRAGGGRGPVRPAGRHLDFFSPSQAGAGGVFRG